MRFDALHCILIEVGDVGDVGRKGAEIFSVEVLALACAAHSAKWSRIPSLSIF